MKEYYLMVCGCVASEYKEGKPYCETHNNYSVLDRGETLQKRNARCHTCGGSKISSSSNLLEFTFRGGGSEYSKQCLNCGFGKGPHENPVEHGLFSSEVCDVYTPRGPEVTDTYFCGCVTNTYKERE